MLTTRDLGLREIQAEKNINETYTQIRKQPVGGLGALKQKSNAPTIRQRFVPTVFVPSPAVSSLPYLDDRVKTRSNENVLMLEANIARQREVRKASIVSDVKKVAELNNRIDETLAIKEQFAPSDRELMRRFLGDQIQKRKQEQQVIEDARRARMDLDLNPTRVNPTVEPIEPIKATQQVNERLPPSPISAADLGQNPQEKLRGLLEKVRSNLPPVKQSFRENISKASEQLASKVEQQYTRKELKQEMNRLRALGQELPPSSEIQSKPAMSVELVKAKRKGLRPIQLAREEPFRNSAGGGTVGGGGLLEALKGQVQ
jgi:hypothetical protein